MTAAEMDDVAIDDGGRNEVRMPETALVIGGSRGIGKAAVLQLAAAGTRVAIGYTANDEAAKATAAEAAALGPEPVLVRGDLGADPVGLVEGALGSLGRIGAIITTAVPIIAGRTLGVSRDDYVRAFDVQVWGLWEAVRVALPSLEDARGSVVAVSSLGATSYARYYGALGPAKAAMEALVRYYAAELGPRQVRINAVSPCLVDNPGHGAEAEIAGIQDVIKAVAAKTPMRRLATPAEIASVAVALTSEAFGFVTGQVIAVDGGYSLLA
jgi:NAD(P)-dependent dehydrogenase (short-subunit alcohol dehydrogenase family)